MKLDSDAYEDDVYKWFLKLKKLKTFEEIAEHLKQYPDKQKYYIPTIEDKNS